jgi:3-methyladenine DNA glycosylase/8-oxoguanine DNA glycosylase
LRREKYGSKLGSRGGFDFYTFPTLEALANAEEEDLRALGMGYRAKFICKSAAMVMEKGGKNWLFGLRELPHLEVEPPPESLK